MLSDLWNDDTGQPTDEGVEVYTEGDCWLLAWCLHELTGWDLILCGGINDWGHVMAERPDGSLVDIHGAQSRAAARVEWGWCGRFMRHSFTDYNDYIDQLEVDGPTFDYSRATARAVAKRVLAALDS